MRGSRPEHSWNDSCLPAAMILRARLTILTGIALALSSAGTAAADEEQWAHRFGAPGFIVSVDRLLPLLSYQSIKTDNPNGGSTTDSRFSLALVGNGPFGAYQSFYNLPRLSFDWLPIQNLTLGGSVWLYTDLSSNQTVTPATGASTTSDQPKTTYWGIAPRVGYVVPLSEKFSFWPRAGVEYYHVSTSDVGSGTGAVSQFAVDLEAMLVISPWHHLGFEVGPTADIPVSGSQNVTSTTVANGTSTTVSHQVNSAMFQIGMSAGMLGHF
jgi:opacity protein-like surface antigen